MLILDSKGRAVGQWARSLSQDGSRDFFDAFESADSSSTPEALLVRDVDEPPAPASSRRPVSLERLHAGLARLEPDEREIVIGYFEGEQSQHAIARRVGKSQPGVHARLHAAIRRLRWLLGPGSRFTLEDIARDWRGLLPARHVRALQIFWRTANWREVHRQLGKADYDATRRMLRKALAAMTGKYKEGFDSLRANARIMAKVQKADVTPVELFLATLDFAPMRRVALVTLCAAYRWHALAVGADLEPRGLFERLQKKGARPARFRTPWSDGQKVVGYVGVAPIVETSEAG
jgi:hypothetical protein